MKRKILPLALLSIFLLTLLVIGRPLIFPDTEEMRFDQEKEKGVVVIYEPEEFSPDGYEAVSELISDIQKELRLMSCKKLREKDPAKIAEFYGNQGVLTADDGGSKIGKKEIYSYFESNRGDITDLEFKLECVYVKELKHILELPENMREPDDIVHVAYLIISVSFDLKGKPTDPPSYTNRRHIRVCEWET